MKAIGIFPTPIFEIDVPTDIYAQVLSLCHTIDWDDPDEKYAGGASSSCVMNFPKQGGILSYSDFTPFCKFAEEHLENINQGILPNNYCSNVKIQAAWVNRYKRGDYNRAHNHPWSIYSGVMFVTGQSGDMTFVKPSAYYDERLKLSNVHEQYTYSPTPGKLVIFPSDLRHYVTENESDTIRYSLAFNAMPMTVYDGHTVQFGNCHKEE